jgi:large subunit ribosomal protein L21
MQNLIKYLIVEISGRQFWMEPDKWYDVNRIPSEVGTTVRLNRVLLIRNIKGKVFIGKPYLSERILDVKIKILKHLRSPKTIVYKMRPKKKTRKKQGHRQELTRICIDRINWKSMNTKLKDSRI